MQNGQEAAVWNHLVVYKIKNLNHLWYKSKSFCTCIDLH